MQREEKRGIRRYRSAEIDWGVGEVGSWGLGRLGVGTAAFGMLESGRQSRTALSE